MRRTSGAHVGALISMLAASACVHTPVAVRPPAAAQQSTGAHDFRLGPVFFDPQGADFTNWIIHFKNEAYRNWNISEPGLRSAGHVDFEMTVERDGSMSALRMLGSTASPIQDEAAHTALRNSRLAALPGDYTGARVTMQITFFYKERPR